MKLKDQLILREVAGQYVIIPTGERVREVDPGEGLARVTFHYLGVSSLSGHGLEHLQQEGDDPRPAGDADYLSGSVCFP